MIHNQEFQDVLHVQQDAFEIKNKGNSKCFIKQESCLFNASVIWWGNNWKKDFYNKFSLYRQKIDEKNNESNII